jgi:hypothetical protein
MGNRIATEQTVPDIMHEYVQVISGCGQMQWIIDAGTQRNKQILFQVYEP